MKIKLISCEVFARELALATATSPHLYDLKFVSFGLHDTPPQLREALQDEIDATEGQGYDALVLGYGLCSRGTAGLVARSIPIIMPRMHDCITALLGSRELYSREFRSNPGTYYYSAGWIERKSGEVQQGFIDDAYRSRTEERYQEYVEKYGEENAKFLIEQESQWHANYSRAALIDMGIGNVEEYRRFVKQLAADHGWEYAEMEGDMSLLRRLADGDWESEDFLRIEPGQTITESFDELVLRAG